jgi:hypothetical protein
MIPTTDALAVVPVPPAAVMFLTMFEVRVVSGLLAETFDASPRS